MKLTRVDIADLHDPRKIARAITSCPLPEGPVRVEEIALALDILEVRGGSFDGFEGMLLTDRVRSRGVILARTTNGPRRARFTIAHELGHFLLERHELTGPEGFRCRPEDLRETRIERRRQRQEAEANQFAIELLAPARLADRLLGRDPDLRDAQKLRDALDISLEAAVRRMIDRRPEALAAVVTRGEQIRYVVRSTQFPFVNRRPGQRIAQITPACRAIRNGKPGFTDMTDTAASAWIDQDIELYEQTRLAQHGHAVTLLEAIIPALDDDNDGRAPTLGVPSFR